MAALDNGDGWIPNCDSNGKYAPEQCGHNQG